MEDLSKNFSIDGKIGFVVDAIYTMARGLHNMVNHHCPNKVETISVTCHLYMELSSTLCLKALIDYG